MAEMLHSVVHRPPGGLQTVTKRVESLVGTDWIHHKVTKSRIPDKVFQPSPEDHEKYGGDPPRPHKLHVVARIKSTIRRPCWEKDVIQMLGLEKAHTPRVHKDIPSVNAKLRVVKHLIRVQPLKLPQGLPTEENMASTCLKSTGELVVQGHLKAMDTLSSALRGLRWSSCLRLLSAGVTVVGNYAQLKEAFYSGCGDCYFSHSVDSAHLASQCIPGMVDSSAPGTWSWLHFCHLASAAVQRTWRTQSPCTD
ncbi:39S ribosomal protein L30, mitochondrial-like [Octodon degus]|uniref:Large ribosomal subunit protein uL30m n=1 Tax=Octodon degus TaxID=10160 RepID=A0A6P6F4X9_OCTDE|nr:39S ribosomal protein L30, mitochondrial-like [Octodon degus]